MTSTLFFWKELFAFLVPTHWNSWVPLNCKIFICLASQHRVWTSDRQVRRGLQDHILPCFL
uniref:Uncharacterized protein n=1 Tax=Triticum urartu TaxID=4572 RepID=A0A8R7QH62_TRIUA